MLITRDTRFYIGQTMQLKAPGDLPVFAVTPAGDAILDPIKIIPGAPCRIERLPPDPSDCHDPECVKDCVQRHPEADTPDRTTHRHIKGLFTPQQVRDAAICSLCHQLDIPIDPIRDEQIENQVLIKTDANGKQFYSVAVSLRQSVLNTELTMFECALPAEVVEFIRNNPLPAPPSE